MISRISSALGRWHQHELAAAAVLFLARLIVRPYMGLVSDAQLYSMQVLNRIHPGQFNADLFLKYGSQDSFSAFSLIVAPLASALGIRFVFFALYGVCLFVLLWGEVRLVRKLIPHGAIAFVSLIVLAVTDVPYAWQGNFSVHECYFTARLPAQALAVWAIALTLQGRFRTSTVLALLATSLHPLMGIGAVGLCVSVWIADRFSPRALAIAVGSTLGGGVVLLLQPELAERVLRGKMDALWLEAVRIASPQCLITEWWISDWLRTAVSIAVVAAGSCWLTGRVRSLAVMLALLGVAGTGVSLLAEFTGYVLLVQGQAYRSLWLVQLLALPIGLWLAHRAWTSPRPGLNAIALGIAAFYLGVFVQPQWDASWLMFAAVVTLTQTVIWWIVLARRAEDAAVGRRWMTSIAYSLAGTAVVLSFSQAASLMAFAGQASLSVPRLFWVLPRYVSEGVLAAAGLALAAAVARLGRSPRRTTVYAALIGSFVLFGWFAVSDRELGDPRRRGDWEFVQRFIDNQQSAGSRPQVYWPTDLSEIWFGLSSASYYNWTQLSGIAFNRETAIESRRRAELAAPFELAHLRKIYDSPQTWQDRIALMNATWSDRLPERPDLQRLAADRELDWIVLTVEYPGAVAASNGSIFVYDCDRLRDAK